MQTPYEQAIQAQRIREQLLIEAERCRRGPRSYFSRETLTEMYDTVRFETAAELAGSEVALVAMMREKEREREEKRRVELGRTREGEKARTAEMDARTPDAGRVCLSHTALVQLQNKVDLQTSGEILRRAIEVDAEMARKRIEEREREGKKKTDLKVNMDTRIPDAGRVPLTKAALVQLQNKVDMQTSGEILRRAIEVDAEMARRRIEARERERRKKADLKKRGEVLKNMIEEDAEKARRALMNREREKEKREKERREKEKKEKERREKEKREKEKREKEKREKEKREMETRSSVSASGQIEMHLAKVDPVQIQHRQDVRMHLELEKMQIASDANGNGSSPMKRRAAN
jgi:hypothetical protein